MFNYSATFANSKQYGKDKGKIFKEIPKSIDNHMRRFHAAKFDKNNPSEYIAWAKTEWGPNADWNQAINKIIGFINCNRDPDVFVKLSIDPAKVESIVLYASELSNNKKREKDAERSTGKRPRVEDMILPREKWLELVKTAKAVIISLLELDLDKNQKDQFQKAVIVVWYYYFNIRTIHNSIKKNREAANHIVLQKDGLAVKSDIYFNYYRTKTRKEMDNFALVHRVNYEVHRELYLGLKKLVLLSDDAKTDYLIWDYINGDSFDTRQFRDYVGKAHDGEVGVWMLRIMKITNEYPDDMPSRADFERLSLQHDHAPSEEHKYIHHNSGNASSSTV